MAGLITMAPPMAPTSSLNSQQTSTSTHSSSHTPTNSSLLFGFLISFFALFIIFLGCGLSSRYMVDRRRQRITAESLSIGTSRDRKPSFWDVWTAPAQDKWKDMMPLSVEVRKKTPSLSPPYEDRVDRQLTPTEEVIDMYRELRRRSMMWATRLRPSSSFSGSPPSRASKPDARDESVDLQIAVLVAMPSESGQARDIKSIMERHETAPEGLADIQDGGYDDSPHVAMGIVKIPWDKQRLDFG